MDFHQKGVLSEARVLQICQSFNPGNDVDLARAIEQETIAAFQMQLQCLAETARKVMACQDLAGTRDMAARLIDQLANGIESQHEGGTVQGDALNTSQQELRTLLISLKAAAMSVELPPVARLYYTGIGARRYRRASTRNGPGEPLCFVSTADTALRRKEAYIRVLERILHMRD
ncbi:MULTISPECIES: hypothetical protein [Achromobacter]|uniref:hypothetical protein n=1 Tax=Achromobacter TaxID=222 RepID=UPI0023F6DA9B|nr:hypothetical protein [Achromobacter anxifer]MDF8362041.1 hypothetical protein [Achromobacter anxifer]